MTDTTAPNAYQALLDKVSELIKASAAGEKGQFSAESLNHVYINLAEGQVDQKAGDLLDKIAGPDWQAGLTPVEDMDDLADTAKHAALLEFLQQIDETKPEDAVATLASALMITCKELGWLEASREAHDQWFFAAEPT